LAEPVKLDLKIAVRPGSYARGQDGLEQILHAALDILVEEGLKGLTFRNIAAKCGLKAGNLAHYFPTKSELLRELLDAIIGGYEEALDSIVHEADATPSDRLAHLISFVLRDITTRRTTRVFPELWAMANHDTYVEQRVEELYARARSSINALIAEINPRLPIDEREIAALFISASMEGMTIFAGHGKPWMRDIRAIEYLAVKAFIGTVETLEPGALRAASLGSAIIKP